VLGSWRQYSGNVSALQANSFLRTLQPIARGILLTMRALTPHRPSPPSNFLQPKESLPHQSKHPKPLTTNSRLAFPSPNLVDTKVVDKQLLGKPFMPGGTLAHYKKGKTEYEMCRRQAANRDGRLQSSCRTGGKALTDLQTDPILRRLLRPRRRSPAYSYSPKARGSPGHSRFAERTAIYKPAL